MKKNYSDISDISVFNSAVNNLSDIKQLFHDGLFSDDGKWKNFKATNTIQNLGANINSRLRNRMSQLSLGIFSVLEDGPGKNINENEELCLFTGFGEIETTDQIIKSIVLDKHLLVSPTLFHNSVHHTSLGYYTIIKKIHNASITVSDGMDTGNSFLEFLKLKLLLNKNIVITAGEEFSNFFSLDKDASKEIVPSFIAYRIKCGDNNSGFLFHENAASIEEVEKSSLFEKADNIFTGKELFLKIKNKNKKKLFTEYPLISDNPAGIIYRLALPFIFELKGCSIILEESHGKIFVLEVNL